jgi:nucleoid-associated protein EbfC
MMNIAAMMKQAQQMQDKIQQLQETLAQQETEGQAGGGLVRVTLSGQGHCRRVHIDPSLLAADEKTMLEDLITTAHNAAKQQIEQTLAQEMGKITGGLNLPPGFKLPF